MSRTALIRKALAHPGAFLFEIKVINRRNI